MSSTFTLFPLLPTELRLKIWSDVSGPRLLHIPNDPSLVRTIHDIPAHPLMHVCRESRAEYSRRFGLNTKSASSADTVHYFHAYRPSPVLGSHAEVLGAVKGEQFGKQGHLPPVLLDLQDMAAGAKMKTDDVWMVDVWPMDCCAVRFVKLIIHCQDRDQEEQPAVVDVSAKKLT